MPYAPNVETCPPGAQPKRASEPASLLLSEDLLQHHLVQRQIGHQTLELGVLLAKLAKRAQLVRQQVRVLLLPEVVRLLIDAELCGSPLPPVPQTRPAATLC